jgi:hypothetical protein
MACCRRRCILIWADFRQIDQLAPGGSMLEDGTIMSIVLPVLSRVPGFRYKMLAACSSMPGGTE